MTLIYDADYLKGLLNSVSDDVYDYLQSEPVSNCVFVGILTNGLFFAKRIQTLLAKKGMMIESPAMGLDISLYRDDLQSKNKQYMTVSGTQKPIQLDNKHVVLFDDVLCTARTARAALNAIFDYGRPTKVSFVVLFDRLHRQVPIEPNITGQMLDVDMANRVNVQFVEVVGDDGVITVPFKEGYI